MDATGDREPQLPPPVHVGLDDTILDYWHARVRQHLGDWYAGVRLLKFPEDLRVYEHLLWLSRADAVVELGSRFGGSAVWFRDRLRTQRAHGRTTADPVVVSVDVDLSTARESLDGSGADLTGIELVQGDVTDPELPGRVAAMLPDGARVLVVEDSAHVYETTLAALVGFSDLVAPGGFFVVEDGCVDVEPLRADPSWPRGVLPALTDWLATEQGARFAVREDLELYGLSCHPQGFLQRRHDR